LRAPKKCRAIAHVVALLRKHSSHMLALKPVERTDHAGFQARLQFYLTAIEREFYAKSEELELRWILQQCTWETLEQEHTMLWDIFRLSEVEYSAKLFDVAYFEELAIRYSLLQELKAENTTGSLSEDEWQGWLYITQNETAIPIQRSVHFNQPCKPTPHQHSFRSRYPEFKGYIIRTENFLYQDLCGRCWDSEDLRALLSTWGKQAPSAELAHLKNILMVYFDSPFECQLNNCRLAQFCPSPCHRLGFQLWAKNKRTRE